ncbi:hypothetical protein [Flavobacterium terrisoli]|uniref:hypothetical protein n=1 Tax=Flavobacterium terrisoli TaxID=3242195 RepID=UPI002543AECF|nr:hypothetical protein [Flavobacterium buctense]
MKINQVYITTKNLDLENENFLVKKGTALQVTNIFDATDTSVPTKVEFKIDKINGNYTLDENKFKNYINDNVLFGAALSNFNVGDCVIHVVYGQGLVISKQYYNSIDSWLYGVDFNGQKIGCTEEELTGC